MFDVFLSKFEVDNLVSKPGKDQREYGIEVKGIRDFFLKFGGSSFNKGLYRIHSPDNLTKWDHIITESFPDFSSRFISFGYDWLGRHFALDKERVQDGEPLVLLFEPGTGEVLEIPANFLDFHNEILVNLTNEAVALDFFNSWLKTWGGALKVNECVGYKKPLFLNGADDVSNLNVVDMEVYWSFCGQLFGQIKDLPEGTIIGNITFE
ncbi:DUF1851 domain-containing protein [Leptospira wolffii]|uniref:T6SS immunity protein Tdi1 domain-containing protein n=1 Tax=Leptospira wolffii TaxID=409998 RepID=UPI001082A799|nr:T6SS immunity protein Tdi1 domain-containing protein [Leptospira wolffii]TGK55116.1 DUF1851 domain-containing protein [Leptospira wolffii]TGK67285.1 DUF1851 domain-containing protein [Leptospira wolffii]TGK70583.1 DUF1851 domain-containing protein [Leptospira wolffii]TGL29880.1 DUF1851 domain-containing protein [Leptospira wolffii]